MLHDLRQSGRETPVIFLSDHIDQVTVAAAINAGAYDLVQTSTLDESSITRAIRHAIDMYCKNRQRQKAEDMLRKLWRAVEQSADLVVITDRVGIIEYANPAFEAYRVPQAGTHRANTAIVQVGQASPGVLPENVANHSGRTGLSGRND